MEEERGFGWDNRNGGRAPKVEDPLGRLTRHSNSRFNKENRGRKEYT